MTKEVKLKGKQLKFAEEYLKDMNATAAYKRAGYTAKGRSAENNASRLLGNAGVAAYIKQRQEELQEVLELETEKVIGEIGRIGLSDIRKLFNEHGALKNINELDDDIAAAVSSVEVTELTAEGAAIGFVKKIKLWDKNSALEKLCKHLGLYEKDNNQKNDPILELLKEINERNTGLPVKS